MARKLSKLTVTRNSASRYPQIRMLSSSVFEILGKSVSRAQIISFVLARFVPLLCVVDHLLLALPLHELGYSHLVHGRVCMSHAGADKPARLEP